jgi:hypothetical protein
MVEIVNEDYALGISDLSGELMRYATNCKFRHQRKAHTSILTCSCDEQVRVPGTSRQLWKRAPLFESSKMVSPPSHTLPFALCLDNCKQVLIVHCRSYGI